MGRRVRNSSVFVSLIVVFALAAGFVSMAVADTSSPISPPAPVSAATFDQGLSSAIAVPTNASELVSKRTEYSTTFQLANGSKTTVFSLSPVYYKDGVGNWQPIDATLSLTSGGSYTTTATPVTVTLANQASGVAPVTIDSGAGPVSLSLLGALEDGLVVSGASASYPTATTATDVTYSATGDGVKETITLASAAAPSTFTFTLTHAGFTLAQDDTGQWALTKPGAAQPSYLIGALSVYDSSVDEGGMPAYCDGARMVVKPGNGASTITYVIPRAWLSDPACVWPVTIDPGVFTQNPTDTYLSAGYPNDSFGTSEDLLCGKVSTATGDCKTLVKFPGIDYDAGGIPNGAHIADATCSIRQYWQPATHSDIVNIGRVSNGSSLWGEGSIWNGTTIDPVSMSSQTTTAMQQWVDIPCVGVVQGWERDDYANKGFVLYESSGAGSSWARKFRSGDYSDSTYRPKLSVTYDTPAMADTLPAAASSSFTIGDTVTVQVTVSSIHDASQITEIRMGTNRTATDTSRRRGTLAWFSSPPTDSNQWVYQKAANGDGYFAYFDSTVYGIGHITPQLGSCTIDSTHTVATFVYKINANWGDVGGSSEWDTCLDMSAGSNTWTSGWIAQTAKTFIVDTTSGAVDPLESLTSTTTATSWFTGTGNDDVATQGRGTVSLSWPAVTLASGYYIYLWDGVKFDYVATTTATSWSTSGKGLYATDSALTAIAQGYSGNPFTTYGTTELRDNPNALYKKIAGSSAQDTDYRFCVVPYNATKGAADVAKCAVLRVTLDNRTRPTTANEDAQHTTYDFGSWDGHDISGELDTGALTNHVTDLSVASYGPMASLSRSYRSDRTAAGLFAPGWFFCFEQNLQIGPSSIVYTDAERFAHTFTGSGSNWTAPNGVVATLTPVGANWRLAFTDQSYLTFDSAGKLLTETDHDGNQTTYTWSAGSLTQITAANGQQITLTYTAGKLSSASYATAAGTRTVNYTTSSPWKATIYPGTGQKQLTYAYDANSQLASITQQDWPASGQSAAESFIYTSGKLTDVRYADYNATSKPDAHATVSYATNQATVKRYGTVAGTANQVIDQEVDTWDATTHLCATRTTGTAHPLTETYTHAFDRQLAMTTGSDASQTSDTINLAHDHTSETATSNSADSANKLTTYAYDSAHRLTTDKDFQSPAVCSTISNTYNANGDLTEAKTLDSNGVTVLADAQYGYDSYSRQTMDKELVTGTPASGTWTETDYSNFWTNGAPQTTVAKAVQLNYGGAAQDLTKTASYDAFGSQLTETDWSNSRVVSTNTYDIAGNQLTSTDAYGIVTHTTYDCMANAKESWQTATGTSMKATWTSTTLDALGRTLTVTTKRSDASGNPTTQSVVTTTYDGNGDTLTAHDTTLGGQDQKTLYDADGNAIQTWAAGVFDYTTAARSTRSVYDSRGNVTYESDPGNANAPASGNPCTATTYDTAGNVLSAKQPDGTQTDNAYDGQANRTATSGGSDALWQASTQTDVAGRQTAAVAAQQSHTGLQTTTIVDELGRTTQAKAERDQAPSEPITSTTYNALGWVLQVVDANGVTTATVYDNHGCVTSVTVGTKTASSTYDADNRLHTQSDAAGNVVTYTYDLFGNTTEAKHQTSGGTVLKDVTTVVDSLGRPTSQSDSISHITRTWSYSQNAATGVQETISYDATPLTRTVINRNARNVETSQVTTIAAGSTVTRATADTTAGRDTADRWISATIQKSGGTLLTESRSFDAAGRYASQSGAGFKSAGSYTYDTDTGKKATDSLPLLLGGTIADSFTYFAGGALGSATTNGVADAFAFDEVGNLVTDNVNGGTATTFTYDAQNRLTQTVAVPADESLPPTTIYYGWDATNDWRTSQGTQQDPAQRPVQFTYTALGRLSHYANATTNTSADYTYDAAGQRTKSAVTVGGTTTTTSFAYDDGNLMSLVATQASSSWRVDYLYDEEGTSYGGVYRSPSPSTSPTYFTIITNDHGDVLELLDASGNAFAAYRYDAWGLPQGAGNYATGIWTQSTSLITSTLAGQIASRQVLRYAGYAYDAETGLYYCSARYFDPVTRQFTTADSAKADGEQSSFQYCSGDPVGNVDPTGEYGANQNHHGIGRTMSQKGVASAWQFEGTGMWTVLGWCQRLGDATGSPSGGPAWCADAVSYMYGSDGYKGRPKSQAYSYAFRSKVGSYSYGGPGFASCLKLHEAAVNHFRGLSWIKFSNRSSVVNGDIIIYNWGTRGTYKHTGIVVNKKSRETIEGNRGAYHSVGHIEHGFDKPDVWDHQVEGFIHVSE